MKNILINNYYDGVEARGIIAYVNNLCDQFNDMGVNYKVLRCPKILRNFPKHGVIFHIFEQIYVPLVGIRYDIVIYPYNSISIFAIFKKGSLLIIHDFIQNRKKINGYKKISSGLVRLTQCIYEHYSGNVAFITNEVMRQARFINKFEFSKIYILQNSFSKFQKNLQKVTPKIDKKYILLCTGKVITKDLVGALTLYSKTRNDFKIPLFILGLSGRSDLVKNIIKDYGLNIPKYEVLQTVSDQELCAYYLGASVVWVHSKREGFGRNIVEGALSERKIICSRIPPFVKQAAKIPNIYLYTNANQEEFDNAANAVLNSSFINFNKEILSLDLKENIKRIINGL